MLRYENSDMYDLFCAPTTSCRSQVELPPTIFLVGYMGAGKSALGKLLAKRLGYSFVDTDLYIENRFRQSIAQIFETQGEAVFRKRERAVIEEVSSFCQTVVATGGGLPLFYGNMELLLQSGCVVYLSHSPDCLVERLQSQAAKIHRPKLKGLSSEELLAHVTQELKEREPVYLQAHCILHGVEAGTPLLLDELVNKLLHSLESGAYSK